MNPCPCGYREHPRRICRCSPEQARRYRARVSRPLLDRFDLHVALPTLSVREVQSGAAGEDSATVRARVGAARMLRVERERTASAGTARGAPLLRLASELEPGALAFLHRAMSELELSLRAYAKVLLVSRTIADLESSARVDVPHVAEAIQYRLFDRADRRERALLLEAGGPSSPRRD